MKLFFLIIGLLLIIFGHGLTIFDNKNSFWQQYELGKNMKKFGILTLIFFGLLLLIDFIKKQF